MKHIREQDYVIALAIDGKTPDSVELSQKIEKLGVSGISSIAFVIGGSLGLSESVLKRADYKTQLFQNDFSASADADDPFGTDIQKLPHYESRTLP